MPTGHHPYLELVRAFPVPGLPARSWTIFFICLDEYFYAVLVEKKRTKLGWVVPAFKHKIAKILHWVFSIWLFTLILSTLFVIHIRFKPRFSGRRRHCVTRLHYTTANRLLSNFSNFMSRRRHRPPEKHGFRIIPRYTYYRYAICRIGIGLYEYSVM